MMDFFGYSYETAGRFWNMALEMYLGTDDLIWKTILTTITKSFVMLRMKTLVMQQAISGPVPVLLLSIKTMIILNSL